MNTKNEIIIEITDMTKYEEINPIIAKHCEFQMGGPIELDAQGISSGDWRPEQGIYKFIENHSVGDLIHDLKMLCKYVVFKDIDSRKILPYIGTLIIHFDNIDYLKADTIEKIDKLKDLKTEWGYCMGKKPLIGPMVATSSRFLDYSEHIQIISDYFNNFIELKNYVENKVLEIDSNFKIEFKHPAIE